MATIFRVSDLRAIDDNGEVFHELTTEDRKPTPWQCFCDRVADLYVLVGRLSGGWCGLTPERYSDYQSYVTITRDVARERSRLTAYAGETALEAIARGCRQDSGFTLDPGDEAPLEEAEPDGVYTCDSIFAGQWRDLVQAYEVPPEFILELLAPVEPTPPRRRRRRRRKAKISPRFVATAANALRLRLGKMEPTTVNRAVVEAEYARVMRDPKLNVDTAAALTHLPYVVDAVFLDPPAHAPALSVPKLPVGFRFWKGINPAVPVPLAC